MQVHKNDLIKGMLSFANEDILPGITDKALQMGLFAVMQVVSRQPNVLNKWLDSPVAVLMLGADGDCYDLTTIKESLTATMHRFGNFQITIPAIPLILKNDATISLGVSDLDSLLRHIEVEANGI